MEGDYREGMSEKIAAFKPAIIIVDSSFDARMVSEMQFDPQKATNACGASRNCLAFIPPWVYGERLEATNLVFAAITEKWANRANTI